MRCVILMPGCVTQRHLRNDANRMLSLVGRFLVCAPANLARRDGDGSETTRQVLHQGKETRRPMESKPLAVRLTKKIALVAHDNKKYDLLEWGAFNRDLLAQHELYATATTGKLLRQELDL